MEHATLEQQVIGTKVIAEQTALDVGELKRVAGRGVIADEPLDGELDICRDLVDRRQYHTALEVLKTTFADGKRKTPISQEALARIRSLEGLCLHHLGDGAAAAIRFLEAVRLNPSIKHRSNAVVAHLIEGNLDEARRVLDGLLAEEPGHPSNWANLVYVESARGYVVPEEEIPTNLRDNQEVRLARANALRMSEDPTWRHLARANMDRFPHSEEASRAGSEAILDGIIEAGRKGPPEGISMQALRLDAEIATRVLQKLWSVECR